MSESVALVQHLIDRLNLGDYEALIQASSEDFELDFSASRGPLSGFYRGREGSREFWESFSEPWDSLQWDPEEIVEIDDGRVLTVSAVRARGGESGAEVNAKGAAIWTVRNGEVVAVRLFQSREEALAS
jgi:ketosteroid isomerase-like protein